jgi:hypothetical protein
VAQAVRQLWHITYTQIGPDKDFTTIAQVVERWASVEVRSKPTHAAESAR